MLSECTTELNLPDGINYTILKEAMLAKGYSFATMEGLTLIAEGTIKNILNGKVKKTSAQNLNKICKVLGVPLEKVLGTEEVKKQIENQGIKEGDASVIALKEIYEHHEAIMNETNEKHIANIRSHYEQHHEDLKENFEKRLADKREIIELLTSENNKLKEQLKKQEHDTKIGNIIRNCIIGLFVCGTITLLILEFIYLEKGWITL